MVLISAGENMCKSIMNQKMKRKINKKSHFKRFGIHII